MPRESGVKGWRYRDKFWVYRHGGSNPHEEKLHPADVEIPVSTPLAEGDWLIQARPPAQYGQKTDHIYAAAVMAVFPDARIPSDADLWYWDGDRVHRAYRRRASPEREERRTEVEAAIEADEDDRLLILYSGDFKPLIYDKNTREWDEAALEVMEGTIKLVGGGPHMPLDEDDMLLTILNHRLAKRRKEIEQAARLAQAGNEDGAAEILGKVAVEVLKGATPGAVQGHNVLHSMPGIVDQVEQIHQVVQGMSAADATADTRATATGGFGQGVGLVDGAWQSVGSLLTFVLDGVRLHKIRTKRSPEERVAKYGHNAVSRQALTLGTSGVKTFSTAWQAVDAIGKVAAFSSSLPAPLTPAVGTLTGLVTTVRSSVQADKSRRRMSRLHQILKTHKGTIADDVQALLAFGMRKAQRKFGFKTGEATVGAVSAVGGAIMIGAIAASANAWNPVGWGIGIVVFIAGAGLLTYKIVRRVTSDRRARKRGFGTAEFPGKLLDAYLGHFNRDAYSVETTVLDAMIRAYGVNPLGLLTSTRDTGRLALATITRHLK
jgi:hypothetical protein